MDYLRKGTENNDRHTTKEGSTKSEIRENRIENSNQYYAYEVESYPDISNEMARLLELRNKNMISEEEFISREMELLSRVYIT